MEDNLRSWVIEYAKVFWEDCPGDFCIQHEETDGLIIFGSTNRVVWTIKRGFSIDSSYCTESFIEHYHTVI